MPVLRAVKREDDILVICLFGQFSLRTTNGEDMTPSGKKASALIALLAECDTRKRARRWVEQILWSDRGVKQARGSLRQTLFELRRKLGRFADILQSDRMSIWLDPDRIRIPPPETGRVFLEGFYAGDPKFRDWLTRKRLAYGRDDRPVGSAGRTVRIQCGLPWTATELDPVGARVLNDQVGGIISGFIAQSTRGVLDTDVDLIVRASLENMAEGTVVSVQVVDARRDVLVHSDHSVATDLSKLLNDGTEMSRFCWKVADGALDRLAASHRDTDAAAMRAAWSQEAISAVLTFDARVMPRSLDILTEAADVINDGLFHALRAWAMMSLIMEDRLEETRDTLSTVRGELEQARLLAPGDPMVLGLAANVNAILFGDYVEAFRLAAAALKGQAGNIFATQAMSLCRFHMGSQDIAYRLSRQNRDIAELTKYGAMCNLHHALLCLRTRRADEALEASRAAAEAVPAYRAPNRQLVALYAAQGKVNKAMARAVELSKIEPGFSVERLINDESYPANTLRETGTLARAKRELGNAAVIPSDSRNS